MVKLGRLKIDFNSARLFAGDVHGRHAKDLIVLHEDVAPDAPGLRDIKGTDNYLAAKGYGIHGNTDAEGLIAWALGLGDAIFYQCGGVNERSIGIEQVSNIMLRSPSNKIRRKIWTARNKQLRATARLVAAAAKAHGIPLRYSDGDHPGVTSHWSVSQHHPESQGHTDCWPVHLGGYYPALEVIALAKAYTRARLV